MKKKYLTLLSFLLLSACSNAPQQTSTNLTLGLVQSSVSKGANQVEITKVLGAPNIISRDNKEMKPGSMIVYQEKESPVVWQALDLVQLGPG